MTLAAWVRDRGFFFSVAIRTLVRNPAASSNGVLAALASSKEASRSAKPDAHTNPVVDGRLVPRERKSRRHTEAAALRAELERLKAENRELKRRRREEPAALPSRARCRR